MVVEGTLTVARAVRTLARDATSGVLVAGDVAGRLHFLEIVPAPHTV
jgi:hypothetical protein